MKRTDIDDNFYQKDRNSSKGKKKTFLKESDTFDRKRKVHFKNFLKNQYLDDEDDEDNF